MILNSPFSQIFPSNNNNISSKENPFNFLNASINKNIIPTVPSINFLNFHNEEKETIKNNILSTSLSFQDLSLSENITLKNSSLPINMNPFTQINQEKNSFINKNNNYCNPFIKDKIDNYFNNKINLNNTYDLESSNPFIKPSNLGKIFQNENNPFQNNIKNIFI